MNASTSPLLPENARVLEGARMLEGSGRQVIAEVNPFVGDEPWRQAATRGGHLARELHDGVLQSMTAAALQVEAAWRLIETDPDAARTRLRDVQRTIGQGQRELRAWVERLESAVPPPSASGAELAAALGTLREQASRQWRLDVELTVDIRDTVSGVLADDIHWIVREALTNVGRHARASVARISIKLDRGPNPVRIEVADDGCGFPFRGRFNLAQLTARGIGPRSLKERVDSLHGELGLTSELSGSRLEISLPSGAAARGESSAELRQPVSVPVAPY